MSSRPFSTTIVIAPFYTSLRSPGTNHNNSRTATKGQTVHCLRISVVNTPNVDALLLRTGEAIIQTTAFSYPVSNGWPNGEDQPHGTIYALQLTVPVFG